MHQCYLSRYIATCFSKIEMENPVFTVKRLRLRLKISLNLTTVSICLNFVLIVYFIETHVQQPKLIKTRV